MPLTKYAPFFPAAVLVVMSDAFNSAWQKLAASLRATKNEQEIETLRTKLAECIVMSALNSSDEGPENLADEALRCLHENYLISHGVPLT
jgi:hypothetical protein